MRRLFTVDPDVNGKGPIVYSWQRQGNYLATSGCNKRVNIVDRQGQLYEQLVLPTAGVVLALDWDYTGDVLAVLQSGNDHILMYTVPTKKKETIDAGMKDLCWLKWSLISPLLAVGTAKGNLLLYDRKHLKKIPLIGKHTKKIVCGAWSLSNKLALGSEDKSVTISDVEGDTVASLTVKGTPLDLAFGDVRTGNKEDKHRHNTVAVNLGKSLYLYNLADPDRPWELQFLPRYGDIVSFRWFGDGYILVGFGSGYVNVVAPGMEENHQEVATMWAHQEAGLSDVAYSAALQKGASVGDKCIKVFDMADMPRMSMQRVEKFELDEERNKLDKLHWTQRGEILTVSSKTGSLYAFLTRIPVLHDTLGTRILYLTSLRELCLKDVSVQDDDGVVCRIGIDVEPALVAIGPTCAAVGMNASVTYYNIDMQAKTAKLANTRTYARTVDQVRVSARHASVLSGGKVTVHTLGEGDFVEGGVRQEISLPQRDDGGTVKRIFVTDKFLIYFTAEGTLSYFGFDDWAVVNEYTFDRPLKHVWPNHSGTRVAVMDELNNGFVYNPVNDQLITIDFFSPTTEVVLWDTADLGIFVGADVSQFTTYVFSAVSQWGPVAQPVRVTSDGEERVVTTPRPFGFLPVLVQYGVVVAQMPSGELVTITLATHQHVVSPSLKGDQLVLSFWNHLSLLHLEDAYRIAAQLGRHDQYNECWISLGEKALQVLDIDLALRVYRHLGQPTMVFALERISSEAERSLLFAQVNVLFNKFQDAQTHFLQSSRPRLALEMRKDLQHFETALKLAEQLAPEQIPELSLLHAQTLEDQGEYAAALDAYEKGVVEVDDEALARRDVHSLQQEKLLQQNKKCNHGIARCTLRLGQLRRGISLATEGIDEDKDEKTGEVTLKAEDKALLLECANILMDLKQPVEAAKLFEKAQDYDEAAITLIKSGKMNASGVPNVQRLLQKSSTQRPWQELAKLKESDMQWREAEAAYEKAGAVFDVIRLNAEHIDGGFTKAFRVVREYQHPEGALLVAKHARKVEDWAASVEFLLIGKQFQEAFAIASQHDEMGTYTKFLGEGGSPEDFRAIADYYDSKREWELAGDYFVKCGPPCYEDALRRYLQVFDTCVRKAIKVVGKARQRSLQDLLFAHLASVSDDPKAERYTFEAYIALGNIVKASHWAVVVAKQERETFGNYRNAHTLLFDMFKDLQAAGHPVTHDLRRSLLLVHSYLIVKSLNKMGDQYGAAQMLVRVSKNINKFPRHVVPILTTTVMECLKAGLRGSAYQFAQVLVRPDYRRHIPDKFRSKIEKMIRKGNAADYVDEQKDSDMTPCPFCGVAVASTTLDCDACQNRLPWCIVSGLHMLKDDWTVCPSCHFPALHSRFVQLVDSGQKCPMCDSEVLQQSLRKVENPDPARAGP